MALHHTAQGLASLGRHGDSVLVHMQPHEVAGLQALAESQGTSLSINPDTGMPEAFNLGDFFSSFLPTIVGAAFAPATGGFSLTPLLAGAATGAGLAKIKGEDPLMGGLMGGLGGYGGSQLGAAASAAGPGGFVPTQAAALTDPQLMASTITPSMMSNPAILNPAANASIAQAAQNIGNQAAQSGVFNTLKSGAGNFMTTAGDTLSRGANNLSNSFQGLTNISGLGNVPQAEAWQAFKAAGGSPMSLAMPVGAAVLDGLEPSDLGLGGPSIDDMRNKTKYRGPQGQLNLDANYNQETGEYEGLPSLRLATGGSVNTNQSSISSGGLQDLYGANDNTTATAPLSQDGFGIGRLDKLAQQGSLTKAGDMFYAAGGPVSFADGGLNLEGSSNLNVETGENNKGLGSLATPLDGLVGGAPGAFFKAVIGKSIGNSGASSTDLPLIIKWTNDPAGKGAGVSFEEYMASKNTTPSAQQGPQGPGYTESIVPTGPNLGATEPTPYGTYEVARPPTASVASYGGDANTPFMARGGYLDGPGDGLSDSIPASIEGKQPARLADGEFVISSDVVSALGNGSSKAGAKHLYAMMDRVRQKAHGTKKQINKVNTRRVMPA